VLIRNLALLQPSAELSDYFRAPTAEREIVINIAERRKHNHFYEHESKSNRPLANSAWRSFALASI
jgi:hypothetical protein